MIAHVLTHRGHDYTIHPFGTVYRDDERMTRAELLALPANGRVWRWLRLGGAKRPRPTMQSALEAVAVAARVVADYGSDVGECTNCDHALAKCRCPARALRNALAALAELQP